MVIRARYKGDGDEHIYGIPKRDISEDEWQQMTGAQHDEVRDFKRSGGKPLYDVSTNKEMAPRAERAPQPVEEAAPKPAEREG